MKVISVPLLILLCSLLGACRYPAEPASEASGPGHPGLSPSREPKQTPVMLDNPNYTREMSVKAVLFEILMMYAMGDGRLLLGGGLPLDYDALIAEGSLTVIPANRYTLEDAVSTTVYSPGDIFFDLDEQAEVLRFYQHMGELDMAYEPDAVPPGQLLPWAGEPNYLTDGRTLYWDNDEIEVGWYETVDPTPLREYLGIPGDDDARTRVYLVYKTMTEIMYRAGWILDMPPPSLDGYVQFIGRRNPVAWTNPYTAQPMGPVPWVVPTKVYEVLGDEYGDPLPDVPSPVPVPPPSQLVGNYAYVVLPSEHTPGEMIAHALFYFYLPAGELAAYCGGGAGRAETEAGSQVWIDMARAGGWVPEEQSTPE